MFVCLRRTFVCSALSLWSPSFPEFSSFFIIHVVHVCVEHMRFLATREFPSNELISSHQLNVREIQKPHPWPMTPALQTGSYGRLPPRQAAHAAEHSERPLEGGDGSDNLCLGLSTQGTSPLGLLTVVRVLCVQTY